MNPKTVLRKLLPQRAIRATESAYRKARVATAHLRYGLPARKLKVIAVTGTNGKTTTCNLINAMLTSAGYRTALFTTAVIEMDGVRTDNKQHRTVPLVGELFAFLREAAQKKVDYVILEITSHALDQHKVWGIPIEVAVMTNLSQDHLDYHGSMQYYAAAKAKLFNRYMHPRHVVLNADDEYYGYYKKRAVGKLHAYGKSSGASVQMTSVLTSAEGSVVTLRNGMVNMVVHTQLVGLFNAYNTTAAATVGLVLGIDPQRIDKGIMGLGGVPGRMEAVNAGQPFAVIVDYAHTPDALRNALMALQEITKGRVIVVFGATGNRDKSKRPLMGKVAAECADYIFLTDDETYNEDAQTIRAAVYDGIVAAAATDKTTELEDRYRAIEAAFRMAKKGDAVLLAGLGHQNYRAMNDGNQPWDDRKVARKLLQQMHFAKKSTKE